MAIGTIPPWVRSPDTLGALSSGASAGSAVARTEQEGVSESARLGMEAQRMRQSAAIEQARLAQADEHAQMEFQAKQKLAEQNQLREQQRLNIENAYKTAALGIAKGRLEQTQSGAEEKAKAAALTFRREQAFARDVASGIPVMEAYQRNPVSSALLSSIGHTQTKEDQADKPVIREGRYPIVRVNPKTGESTVVYTPQKKESAPDILGAANSESTSPQPGLLKRLFGGGTPTPTAPSSKDKLVRAHALGIAHPDWTKEQIIDAVNKEMP